MNHGPIQLVAYMTTKCNLKCEFCRRQRGCLDMEAPEIKPPLLKRVFGMFPSITGVSIAGFGEPLLAEKIVETVDFCLARGKNIVLSTNGLAYRRHMDSIPWDRFLQISLSVNEVDRELYKQATGVDGLPRAIEAAEFFKSAGARVGFTFVVGMHNWERIPSYLYFAKSHDADFIGLFNTLPHHDDKEGDEWFRSRVLTSGSREYLEADEKIRKYAAELGITVHTWPQPLTDLESCPRGCSSPFNMFGIDGLGRYTGCCRVLPPSDETGSIDEGRQLWAESEHLNYLRDMMHGTRPLEYPCTECFGAFLPRGGWFERACQCVPTVP